MRNTIVLLKLFFFALSLGAAKTQLNEQKRKSQINEFIKLCAKLKNSQPVRTTHG